MRISGWHEAGLTETTVISGVSEMKEKAFTLIELLIVVAIIGILAIIAVPNFSDSATRSKIAAARSDMRTLASALEVYHVDNNAYPQELGPVNGPKGAYNAEPSLDSYGDIRLFEFKGIGPQITTPVAYVSSLPVDPFKIGAVATVPPNTGKALDTGNPFDEGFTYIDVASWVQFENPQFNPVWANSLFGSWSLLSLGPNQIYDLPTPNSFTDRSWIYDPTNGTTSRGVITRTANRPTEKF
jgi:prepilin-type N-terminal cleavage/methylation domain-containing protein